MDTLNNIDNIDSIMGYDDSYEFQDIEKFSIPKISMNFIHNLEGINEYENYEIVEDNKENFSNDVQNNDLKKITLLDCPNEDIIWSTKTLGAQSSGNQLFFDRDESLKLDNTKNIYLYTKDLKKQSKINKIVHMNSPNNNCPSTRITVDEDQDFSGETGEIFFVGVRKEEDKPLNKTNEDVSSQKREVYCPSCPPFPSCPKPSPCPPNTICPKSDIKCNSIYYFIIGFILNLIICGLVYYFLLYKKEE